jgi:hypothetical protein
MSLIEETVDRFNFLNAYNPGHPTSREMFMENRKYKRLYENAVAAHQKLYGKFPELEKNVYGYLPEGIDLDKKHNLISYNPNHENYVDTSLDHNPTSTTDLGDVEVWSIFKRKKMGNNDVYDGNPLLYAYKGEGWDFKNPEEKMKIDNQMIQIINKFNKSHSYESTIIIPSGSSLNMYIGELIKNSNPKCTLITDVIWKIPTEEVFQNVTKQNSKFRKIYGKNYLNALRYLENYIAKMNKDRQGYFTYHFIHDKTMRNAIENTLKISPYSCQYSDNINEKDVLIVDDSISRGATIKQTCKIIKDTFIPKSLSVLTMFSNLKF